MSVGLKIGRTANVAIREQAQKIVDQYRPVLESEDGEYVAACLPETYREIWGDRLVITHTMALKAVLENLQKLADTGTFESLADHKRTLMTYMSWVLQRRGVRRKEIIETLMAEYHVSKSTVERTLRKAPLPDNINELLGPPQSEQF